MACEVICQICGNRHPVESMGEFCSICGNSLLESVISAFESLIERAKNTDNIKETIKLIPNCPNIESEIVKNKLICIKQIAQDKMKMFSRLAFTNQTLKEFGKLMTILDEEIRLIKTDMVKILDPLLAEYSNLFAIRNQICDNALMAEMDLKLKQIIRKINDILLIFGNLYSADDLQGIWDTKKIISNLLI